MCGIIGYVGESDAVKVTTDGLARLEYRGYDSAGIALSADDSLTVHKREGGIDDLRPELPETTDATQAIGHMRWSTHGEPSDANAHPHTDCEGRIAVVHNGIIDNYDELREELQDRHVFESETDTEVVPHLFEEELEPEIPLHVAATRVADRLEGSFALAVTVSDREGMIGIRQDSPLVVGHGETTNFLASDIPAFIEHTQRVSYLQDGDIVRVTDDDVTVYSDGEEIERDVETVDWDVEAAEKGGYEHFMLKEIHEQPQAVRQTLSGRIDEFEDTVDLECALPSEYLNSLEEIQLVACGTSYHAGLYAKDLLEEYADVRVTVEVASEYAFDGGRDPWRTLVVPITQSGETADTLSAVRRASASGTKTLAITNTVGSTVTREVDETLFIRAGPEIGVAATKTFISQVATLALFAVHLGTVRGTLEASQAADILADLQALPGAIQRVLDTDASIQTVAERYADSDAFFFIGRKSGYPVAIESALKLKEISYDHAEGFPAGELKHGPLALVTPDTTVLAVLTEETAPAETLNNVSEVDTRGASVLGLASETAPGGNDILDTRLHIPDAGRFNPLVANVACQLFAYYIADLKNRNIDKPRNLAKSVTVE